MVIGPVEFRPGLWPTVAVLVCLPILVSLGLWQLDRAAQKRDRQLAYDQAADGTVIRLSDVPDDPATFQHRMVEVRGHFDPARNWLLDNRTHHGRAGYHVLTPLRTEGGDWVAVNRGWVPVGPDRRLLPAIETPQDTVTLQARIKLPPQKIFLAGQVEQPSGAGTEVIQYIDLTELGALVGEPLRPFLLRLAPDQPYGYVREWVLPGFGQDKHLAYAVQWFGIGFALVALYLGHAIRRRPVTDPPDSDSRRDDDD